MRSPLWAEPFLDAGTGEIDHYWSLAERRPARRLEHLLRAGAGNGRKGRSVSPSPSGPGARPEIVDERTTGRPYHHRLMDYNNDPSTRLQDVQSLFAEALRRIA